MVSPQEVCRNYTYLPCSLKAIIENMKTIKLFSAVFIALLLKTIEVFIQSLTTWAIYPLAINMETMPTGLFLTQPFYFSGM